MMRHNKIGPKKTARDPYVHIASNDDPLVLIPDPELIRRVENAINDLDEAHSGRSVAT